MDQSRATRWVALVVALALGAGMATPAAALASGNPKTTNSIVGRSSETVVLSDAGTPVAQSSVSTSSVTAPVADSAAADSVGPVALGGTAAGSVGSLAASTTADSETAAEQTGYESGQLVVSYRSSSTGPVRTLANKRAGVGRTEHLSKLDPDVALATLAPGVEVAAAVAALRDDPSVVAVQPNYTYQVSRTPNDYYFASNQWALNNTGQTGGAYDADIDAPEAWSTVTGSSRGAVAVVDSGVLMTHEDLNDNIWTNPGEIAGNGIDDDRNGYVDDVHGWDFVNNDANPTDDNGHGTNAASIIGAEGNNGVGVSGVAWDVSILPLKVIDAGGGGTTAGAIAAFSYAAVEGVRIINNSWGVAIANDPALEASIERTNALFVCASGNGGYSPADGSDPDGKIGDNNDLYPFIPAALDSANVIAVGATTNTDARASFSNYGATSVDLFAPGVSILGAGVGSNSRYVGYTGTSMAAPQVSGVAALMLAANPALSVAQLKAGLLGSVDRKTSLTGACVSGGRVNAAAAVARATQGSGTLTGKITHKTAPVVGATVTIGTTGMVATTADDGTYSLANVPAGTHTVTVAADGLGAESLAGVAIANASTTVRNVDLRAASALTMAAPVFTYSSSTRLTGTLSYIDSTESTAAVAIAGATITLTRSVDGGAHWTTVGTTVTSSDGSWFYDYNPPSTFERNHLMRATYAGSSTGPAGSSVDARIEARTYLSTPTTSVSAPVASRSFQISGYIGPKFTAGTRPARALIYRRQSNGTWALYKTVSMKAYLYSSTRTRLKVTTAIGSRGYYRVTMRSLSTVKSATGYTFGTSYGGYKSFRVR